MSITLPAGELGGTVRIPKSFHVRERDRAYDDWTLSIWREYFQNSIDAGATRIDIGIYSAVPKGYEGRDPDARSVTRLVFQDDGGGMSLDVLKNVYFALGETTKGGDDDSVGGFGRARIMQNFGNVRYSIRTQDLLVEGDGSDFRGYRMRDVPEVMERWADITVARASELPVGEERDFLEAAAEARRRDAEEMRLDDRFLKGTRFEVDLDPSKGKNDWSKPSVSHMTQQLEQYLSQSDLRCQVFVNGIERSRPLKKREVRKDIFATLDPQEILDAWKDNPRIKILDRPDGRKDVAFGKILVSDEAGQDLVVRVSGASMFRRTVWDSPKSLVIELSPVLAREVMTSNRDGLKEPYQRAVDHFQKMMSTDARAALEKREEKQFTVLAGGKGRRVAKRPQMDFSGDFAATPLSSPAGSGEPSPHAEVGSAPPRRTWIDFRKWQFDEFLKEGLGGVPRADFTAFFDAAKRTSSIEGTFLKQWRDVQQASNFLTTLQRNGESAALETASGEMLAFLCNELRDRRVKADLEESIRHATKLSGLHDVPIMKENLRPDAERLGEAAAKERRTKLLSAINRADPRAWDPASGKGMKPRKILAMWQVAVDACVDLLMATQPRQKPFPYAAGFYFAHPKWQHQPHTGEDGWSNALAMFTRPDSSDETRYFLLNPLKDDDFTLSFNPSQAADRSDMVSRAMHEVAHVVAPDSHNERFAGALTFMLGKMTPGWIREVNRSMDAAVASVDAIYAGARTRVQPLDDEPGLRPGDVLMESLPGEVVRTAAVVAPDGTRELDCDRIDMLESAMVGLDPGVVVDYAEEPTAPRPGM